MARRTSRRRTSKNKRKTARTGYYIHYKTPSGIKKVKKLGTSKETAGKELEKWKSRVRGKGYRTLKIFSCRGGITKARTLVSARKAAKKRKAKKRRSSRRPRRNSRRRSSRRRRSRRSSRTRANRRRKSRRRKSRRPRRNSRRRSSRRRSSRRRTSRRRRAG